MNFGLLAMLSILEQVRLLRTCSAYKLASKFIDLDGIRRFRLSRICSGFYGMPSRELGSTSLDNAPAETRRRGRCCGRMGDAFLAGLDQPVGSFTARARRHGFIRRGRQGAHLNVMTSWEPRGPTAAQIRGWSCSNEKTPVPGTGVP
ncbi:hypothetical protein CHELA40_13842 [Chelatococcus asaccharovorans]|nr:hypothetical protein CHELA40_13842 [Chelatococcus asaccharovorans]CAH1675260.1 hypothetical protein CHELA17_61786 [Chelatococcus asaccharovorans]